MCAREVVITGTGLITSLGKNVAENWKNLLAMKTGISCYHEDGLPDFSLYKGKISQFEIPDDISQRLYNQMKFLNRGSLFGFLAAMEAASQSRINFPDIPPGRRALYIASEGLTNVSFDFMYPAIKDGTNGKWQDMDFEKLNNSALNKVETFFLLKHLGNNLFSFLSSFFELMGPNTSLASLSPCGGQALELAYRSIKQNKADIALTVGNGSLINELALYEFEGLGMLSQCRTGVQSFKPFDKKRDGSIKGEGGAAILLESSDTAKKRGADILGKIKGCGNCIEFSEDRDLSIPLKVSKRSIKSAIAEAGCSANDLAFIIPHGSGTQKGDRAELRSVIDALDGKGADISICGLKPYTGDMGATSDISEIIIGIKAATSRVVPATLNFESTEKEFSALRISNSHLTCEQNSFLSTSYGICGQSSSVVIETN